MGMKNKQVFFSSLFALVFVVLGIVIDWLFLIPAIIIMIKNQKKLIGKNKTKKSSK